MAQFPGGSCSIWSSSVSYMSLHSVMANHSRNVEIFLRSDEISRGDGPTAITTHEAHHYGMLTRCAQVMQNHS